MNIAFLFTCYNRIEKTRSCIRSIKDAIAFTIQRGIRLDVDWYIVDAGSKDNTTSMIKDEIDASKLHTRVENGAYYSQGMRVAMEMCKNDIKSYDFIFIINDDVLFESDFLHRMLSASSDDSAIAVGATCDNNGLQSYGGIRYDKPINKRNGLLPRSIHYNMVKIEDSNLICHTFNANCVKIPYDCFVACDVIDKTYIHSLGDFDYGMCLHRAGYVIKSTDYYVGVCENNTKSGTWLDKSLSIKERVKALNSVKGSPTKQWFYFLKKNFGVLTAILYSISPYIRIVLKK